MNGNKQPFMIVERGVPFEPGTVLTLNNNNLKIGRSGGKWLPDVPFENVFISRKHAMIFQRDDQTFVKDLGSKHGTYVNGNRLTPDEPSLLQHGDRVSFAKEIAVLRFSAVDIEETFDLSPLLPKIKENTLQVVELDPVKQIVSVEGEVYSFSEKEFLCIELLVKNYGEFVAKGDLLPYVWPERIINESGELDISTEEVNSLLYRVRKKVNQTLKIETIRGKGYILEKQQGIKN